MHKGLPVCTFESAEDFEAHLQTQAAQGQGLWLRIGKKGSPVRSISKADAIDVALCHGWIDGQLDRYDDDSWLIRFTPRRPQSRWSEANRRRAQQLMEAGRMKAGGLAEVEAAQADGRWDAAYPSASKAEVPPDLAAALTASPTAAKAFRALDGANRYAILYRVHTTKTAAVRAAKIAKFVQMLERGEKLKP